MPGMQATTYLKNALSRGEKCIGFWLTYNAPPLAKTILATGDYTWALIDAEHGQITDADFYVDDARRIVRFSKYPPVGSRGYGPMFSAHTFGIQDGDYPGDADANLLVIVQIESREGIESVEEIAAVEGVDVLFIGPFDLCKFMNVPFGSEEHEAAIQRVLKAAKTAGKGAAIFCSDGQTANKRLGQGFDMASTCTDAAAVITQFRREYQAARGSKPSNSGSVY